MRCAPLAISATFMAVMISPALAAAAANKLPPLLVEVEAKYAKAATLMAEFSQVNEVSALKQKKTSSGILLLKRPNKLRWETLQPDPNILVSDGKKFWYYTPPFDEDENGQLIERKSAEVQSRLANALLQGSFSIARDMKIKKLATALYELKPKKGTAGTVDRAIIEIDVAKLLIEKVTLEHRGGNRSEIALTKIELGKPIGDDIFRFVPPPNTDRVE